jgi:hypothetical protein
VSWLYLKYRQVQVFKTSMYSLKTTYHMELGSRIHAIGKMICVVKNKTLKHLNTRICTYCNSRTYMVCRESGDGTPQSCTSVIPEMDFAFGSKNPTDVSQFPPLGVVYIVCDKRGEIHLKEIVKKKVNEKKKTKYFLVF